MKYTTMARYPIFLLALFLLPFLASAQNDTLTRPLTVKPLPPGGSRSDSARVPVDTMVKRAEPLRGGSRTDSVMRAHSPKKAALRSALVPGWGQIYNRKYWKLPIIYGALGTTGAIFAYNLKNYRDLRLAYKGKVIAATTRDAAGNPITPDSTLYRKIRRNLLPIEVNALRSYRDEFRRNIDYTVLAFVLLWGLNVVDATVDAHLKPFDVSPDLSMKIRAGRSSIAGTTGLSLIFAFK